MKVARGPKAVWTMLLLPPVTLALFISAYMAFAGVSLSDPGAEETIRSALGPLHFGNGVVGMLNATVYGVLLAGIFLWRRNLVAGTTAHAGYNFLVLLT